jgi:UDPglucose 6-dehydrogenase
MAMRITVLGTGYEGLTISAGLAALGHSVTAVNTDHSRIRRLQRGIEIEGDATLSKELKRELREGVLKFTSEPESCLAEADVVIIAGISGERTAILRAAECLSGAIASFSTVLVTSRIPVGSCRLLQDWLNDALFTTRVNVVAFPVFFSEPDGLRDFLHPGRIVLGYESEQPRRVMDELFADLLLNEISIFHVSWEAAEMMRAVNGPISSSIPGNIHNSETVIPSEPTFSRIGN